MQHDPTAQLAHFSCCAQWWRDSKHTESRCSTCGKTVKSSNINEVCAAGMFRCSKCGAAWASLNCKCTLRTQDICSRCGTSNTPVCIGNGAQREDFLNTIKSTPPAPDADYLSKHPKCFYCTQCKHEFTNTWVLPMCLICRTREFIRVKAVLTFDYTAILPEVKLSYCVGCKQYLLCKKTDMSPVCRFCAAGDAQFSSQAVFCSVMPLEFEKMRKLYEK